MPLFMDVHTVEGGVSAADVAGLHEKDLAHQHKHDVRFIKYWVDEPAGKIFCLSEAPNAEAPAAVHRDARGALADETFEVGEYS
ncbi:MAG: DUF4242 domain-containing protein [Demequina sp.]|jgi:hypothetical protein|nr:DUF4242 domain-containing protein [Demequina sp.]